MTGICVQKKMEKTIQTITFDGTKSKFRMWHAKFMSQARTKEFSGVINGTDAVPNANVTLNPNNNAHKPQIAARKANQKGYDYLLLCMDSEIPFDLVETARTTELLEGDLKLAMERLVQKYMPTTQADVLKLKEELTNCKLKSWKTDLDKW